MAASGANETSRDRYLKRRKQRFADVAYAIDSLIDWVKLERRNYKERAVSTPARRQPLKTPGHQGKRVAEDIREAECTIHGDEHIRLGNKAASGAEDLNLDEEREASDADSSSSSSSGSSRQRTAKKEELQEALSVEKKLGNLSKVKPSASTAPGESRHAVVYDIYRNTTGDTPFDRSATGEADGEGSDDSDSSIDEHSHPTNQPTHPPDTDKSRLLTREIEPVTSSGSLSSDWVITSCKERGTIQITPWSTWRGRCDLALINTFPAREKALYHYGRVFGGEALASGSIPDRDTLMLSMAEMFKEFDGELWAADVEQVARCMRHIPDEILERISLHEFVEQYDRLRSWVHRLRTSPFGREFLNLVRCKVTVETPATTAGGPVSSASTTDRAAGHGLRTTSTTDGAAGHWQRATSTTDGAAGHWQHTTSTTDGAAGHWQRKAFWTDAATIAEATDHTFIPRIGTYVHVRRQGKCRVQKIETRVCNTRLYRWIMSTQYEEIRALKIWNMVRAYQRCTLLAIPSESLAESVGSILADAACSSSGRPKDVSAVTQATIVRIAGLRGHGGEEGIMADALNFHFGGKGPESWHVRRGRRAKSASGDVCAALRRAGLQRRIRLAESQPWVHDTLLDVAKSGQQTFCKVLPRPSNFIEPASGSSHVSATGDKTKPSSHSRSCEDRRSAVQGERHAANPSAVLGSLWSSIRASVNSLSSDQRPGKHFR